MVQVMRAARVGSRVALTVLAIALTSVAEPLRDIKVPDSDASSDSRKVSFDISPLENCNFGDLDLVLNELSAAKGELRLQLSVESIDGVNRQVIFGSPREKKPAGNNRGTYDVLLAKSASPRTYMVFLCSVKPEELDKAPCSQTKVLRFNDMMRSCMLDISLDPQNGLSSPPFATPEKPQPKVYFAQFLFSADSSLWIPGKSTKQPVESLTEEVRTETRHLIDVLGSLPLRVADERVQIVMPFFSDEKCNDK